MDEILARRDACPSCASKSFDVLLREPYRHSAVETFLHKQYEGRADTARLEAEHYELVRCRDCRLAFQLTIPGPRLIDELYNNWIPSSERERLLRERDLDNFAYMAEQVQFLISHLRMRPYSIDVLDFGMGWAEWATMAKAHGCRVSGAELSPERVQYARSVGIEVIDWDEIPRRQFHFINVEQVFEHLVEPAQYLKHLVSGLAPNGVLLASVPNARSVIRTLSRSRHEFASLSSEMIMPIQPLEHINCFDYDSLARLGQTAGLRPVRPSLLRLYNCSAGWLRPRHALRLLTRPIYRHIYPKSTIVYFERA